MDESNALHAFNGVIKPLDIVSESLKGDKLQGLRFTVKDICAIAGETTGFGNPDWKQTHKPSAKNAPAVDLLLGQGAHLTAISCSDELAFSLDGINVHYGTPENPQWPERIPGGSSSGPASMVAAKLVDFAIGTDTAGSIRVPASYCGIYSLRPTYAAIDSTDFLPLGPSFDTVGILAPSIETLTEVALCLLKTPLPTEAGQLRKLIILEDCFNLLSDKLAPDMMAALPAISSRFLETVTLKNLFAPLECANADLNSNANLNKNLLPHSLGEMVDYFSSIRGYEAWQCHGQWIQSVNPEMAESVKERFLLCRNATASGADQARLVQNNVQKLLADLLGDHSVICLPTTADLPPLRSSGAEFLQANRIANMKLCSIASFAGLPQVTLPLPLNLLVGREKIKSKICSGMSLIAGKNQDAALLAAARSVDAALSN